MKIGFMGGGQMARALAAAFVRNEQVQIMVFEPDSTALTAFTQLAPDQVTVADSNREVAASCDLTLLAVKPQVIQTATADLDSSIWPSESVLVSVVAGISIGKLAELTGNPRVIRVMPNTPCLIGQGAMGVAVGDDVAPNQIRTVLKLLEPLGLVVQTSEEELHGVTGLSGSGPAYVFTFIEALSHAGVAAGLPAKVASQLAVQTVLGSVLLVQQSGDSPDVLRQRVTSPGGTTLKGLEVLDQADWAGTLRAAVAAAAERSKELAQ